MGFKEKFARNKLKNLAAKVHHLPVVPNVNTIKVIGVIWQPSQKDAYTFLKNYFNREHVIFRGFCVFEEDVNPPPYTNTITTADLNWWGLPRHEKVDEFLKINFDVLLNVAVQQSLVLDYITALSNARFKVGWSPDTNNYFDLNIKIGENDDSLYLAKQQIFYLAQLNNNND
jgi:hypothetical protein